MMVVDNFEHVLDASPAIAEMIVAAPALKVVATSRSPLDIRGEHLYQPIS